MAQPTTTANKQESTSSSASRAIFTALAIILSFVLAVIIYVFVLGNNSNFEGGDPIGGHPLNWMGTIYKGGYVVPVNITLLIMTIVFSIERFITLGQASGKGSIDNFLKKIKTLLNRDEIESAIRECDRQRGSVANVVRSGLEKYEEVRRAPAPDKETDVLAINKEIEEATTLELPMLQRNLVIIATIASIATLMGLLGTVLGMIKAFSALATAGAPDAVALSTGISEALINTALGIGISALAIVMYNYFSSKIDALTFRIDEAGFTITQTYATQVGGKPQSTRPATV